MNATAASRALVIEDDISFRSSLVTLLRAEGYAVDEAGTVAEARAILEGGQPDVVLLDIELPDGRGLELRLSEAIPSSTPFVVISGQSDAEAARAALRQGATDFLLKPLDPGALRAVLHALQARHRLASEVRALRAELRAAGHFGQLVGRSAPMQRVYDLMSRVAPTAVPVLVTGESGTGKELVAQTLHELSPRSAGPFVAINCGAIPETLIESRLFGHEKGAFTGADRRHVGVFERAHEGTLFLDEVGEMPPELQVRLLRVLETGEVVRIGSESPVAVDVRVVAATNRDPLASIKAGRMREDLYHRLNVFPIHLPPLRERGTDIQHLAQVFLERLNEKEGTHKQWAPEALRSLGARPWTGNVRELRNAVQRAFILASEVLQDPEGAAAPLDPEPASSQPAAPIPAEDELVVRVGSSLADVERKMIFATLRHCEGNKRKTARVLGVSAKTLYKRLAEYEAAAKDGAHADAASSESAS